MGDRKNAYEHLPIPSYEEAISSRPGSSPGSSSRIGPEEISDDAERQGLLRSDSANYRPPTVESARNSLDSLDGLDGGDEEEVRRDMEQMDIEDPLSETSSNRSFLRYRLSKSFSSFASSFSSLSLPSFRRWIPSFHFSWPSIDHSSLDANRVVIIGRLFGVFLIMGVLYVLIASDVLSFTRNRMGMGQMYDPESIRIFIQNNMNARMHMQKYLQHITDFPHVAGTEGNYVLGEWIAELFKAHDLEDVHMEEFQVYLNYPTRDGRKLAIVAPEELRWEASLEEQGEESLVFHGHSKSGNVTGPLVYANYGSREDFKFLEDQGIQVKDSIVLVRYYGTQPDRALKVKAAELAGAKACIIFSDPADDGYIKGPAFPDGRFMPQDGVQRGAVSLMSWVIGDVLTPGWASTPDNKSRLKPEASHGLVQIPSLPVSWLTASSLLATLQNKGTRFENHAGVPDFEYWTGDDTSPTVQLVNKQDEVKRQPIYNVLGKITGWESASQRIIVGNHRDAWCTGAADPGSGTAIMLEVVRIFGELRRLGWRPLRTIEFASWDGEEYNLIGSTEHVENRLEELRKDGVAYLNVDVGVSGTEFRADASPIFETTLRHVINRVGQPSTPASVRKVWEDSHTQIGPLGAGSDFVAFQDMVGTSSIDMFFKGDRYPYHSCYDNYDWMERFGDPEFAHHKAMGEIWALLILDLADRPLLPFDLNAYARAIHGYIDELQKWVDGKATDGKSIDLNPLRGAADTLASEAGQFHAFDQTWREFVFGAGGFESASMGAKRMAHNERLSRFESNLLDLGDGNAGGLANRTQFKHVIYAPQTWDGYGASIFPGVRDWVDAGNWDRAQREVAKIAQIVETAAKKLNIEEE